MSSLNKYFKRKKTKNLLCFGILFPKGELQKFHRPSRQIAPESLPVSGNVFCLKKNHLIFRQKKVNIYKCGRLLQELQREITLYFK